MYGIIAVFSLLIYLMVIHFYYSYKNTIAQTRSERLMEVTATDGNPKNLFSDYESNTYKMKIIYTFEKWMDRMGVEGYVTFEEDGNMKYKPKDKKSIPKSKWTTAKIMTALEVMFYPIGE